MLIFYVLYHPSPPPLCCRSLRPWLKPDPQVTFIALRWFRVRVGTIMQPVSHISPHPLLHPPYYLKMLRYLQKPAEMWILSYIFKLIFAERRKELLTGISRVSFSIYLHELSLWCQRRCRYSYPGTLLFNKVIFVFLYLNICYLNASLSSYGSSTGIFILGRGYTERDSASEAIWRFSTDWSRSISEDRCFFLRLIECVRGFCTHQC